MVCGVLQVVDLYQQLPCTAVYARPGLPGKVTAMVCIRHWWFDVTSTTIHVRYLLTKCGLIYAQVFVIFPMYRWKQLLYLCGRTTMRFIYLIVNETNIVCSCLSQWDRGLYSLMRYYPFFFKNRYDDECQIYLENLMSDAFWSWACYIE